SDAYEQAILERQREEFFRGLECTRHDGLRHTMIDKLERAPALQDRQQLARDLRVRIRRAFDDLFETENRYAAHRHLSTKILAFSVNDSKLCAVGTTPNTDFRNENCDSRLDFQFLFSRHCRGRTR